MLLIIWLIQSISAASWSTVRASGVTSVVVVLSSATSVAMLAAIVVLAVAAASMCVVVLLSGVMTTASVGWIVSSLFLAVEVLLVGVWLQRRELIL